MVLPDNSIYPCAIVPSRYRGVYSGGQWLAFPLHFDQLPLDWDGEDTECTFFWEEYKELVGKGPTPNHAWGDLKRQLEGRKG